MLSSFQMRDIKSIKKSVKELFELQERLKHTVNRLTFRDLSKMFNVSERTIRRWKKEENLPIEVYIPMINKLVEIGKKEKH